MSYIAWSIKHNFQRKTKQKCCVLFPGRRSMGEIGVDGIHGPNATRHRSSRRTKKKIHKHKTPGRRTLSFHQPGRKGGAGGSRVSSSMPSCVSFLSGRGGREGGGGRGIAYLTVKRLISCCRMGAGAGTPCSVFYTPVYFHLWGRY